MPAQARTTMPLGGDCHKPTQRHRAKRCEPTRRGREAVVLRGQVPWVAVEPLASATEQPPVWRFASEESLATKDMPQVQVWVQRCRLERCAQLFTAWAVEGEQPYAKVRVLARQAQPDVEPIDGLPLMFMEVRQVDGLGMTWDTPCCPTCRQPDVRQGSTRQDGSVSACSLCGTRR
jgi:hypothetical protein